MRLALYLALTAMAVLGAAALNRQTISVGNSSTSAGSAVNARDAFDDLYHLLWRVDGGAGNTVVEAVYITPSLAEALAEYSDRSALQQLTLDSLRANAQADTTPILILLEHPIGLDPRLDLAARLDLRDQQGRGHPLLSVTPLSQPVAAEVRTLQAIAWFRTPAGSVPQTLTLTVSDLPETTRPSTFSWNTELLGLLE